MSYICTIGEISKAMDEKVDILLAYRKFGATEVNDIVDNIKGELDRDQITYSSDISTIETNPKLLLIVYSRKMAESELYILKALIMRAKNYQTIILTLLVDGPIDNIYDLYPTNTTTNLIHYYRDDEDRRRFIFTLNSIFWRPSVRCYIPGIESPLVTYFLKDGYKRSLQYRSGVHHGIFMCQQEPTSSGKEVIMHHYNIDDTSVGVVTYLYTNSSGERSLGFFYLDNNGAATESPSTGYVCGDYNLSDNVTSNNIRDIVMGSRVSMNRKGVNPIMYHNQIPMPGGGKYKSAALLFDDRVELAIDGATKVTTLEKSGSVTMRSFYIGDNYAVLYDGETHILNNKGIYTKTIYKDNQVIQKYEECYIDLLEGSGSWLYPNGNRYEGEFRHGRSHGKGTLKYAEGDIFVGEFTDGAIGQSGELTYKNGNVYTGEFRSQRPNGVGELKFTDGSIYRGEFCDGWFSGKGEMNYPNGDRHTGLYESGKRQGLGEFFYSTGAHFKGEFHEWDRDNGALTFANGSVFEGQFSENLPSKGALKYPDGVIYTGEFKDAKLSGQGKMVYDDGSYIEGHFEDGEIKEGRFVYPSGNVIVGRFANWSPQGVCRKIFKDGSEYKGEFKDWKFGGKGTFTYPDGRRCIGTFVHGSYFNGEIKYEEGSKVTFKKKAGIFGW